VGRRPSQTGCHLVAGSCGSERDRRRSRKAFSQRRWPDDVFRHSSAG
jgi:hypothetical protein